MISAVDLRKGKAIIYEGNLCTVHEIQHVAKGNKRSYMQAKLRNQSDGSMREVRFRVDEKVEIPFVESKEYEYLYQDGANFIVMDTETFDQIPIPADDVGDASNFLRPNERVTCQFLDGKLISFELPFVVELEVTDTPPVVKGATATNQNKDATLETGARVKVPPFISPGERVRIDTRTGEYVERAK